MQANLTGIIDPPVTVFSTLKELKQWQADLAAMPDSPQRDIALRQVALFLTLNQGNS